MSNNQSRSSVITAVFIALLVVGVGGGYLRMRSSQLSAINASKNVVACRELAARIRQLQIGPRRAELKSRSETELSRKIETAAQTAGLPANHIVRIEPGEPRRVADSDYKDQATDVELRPVTLKELIAFLDAIASDTGVQVNFVWLSSPDQEATTAPAMEPWNVQMTLTNLIFAPKS
jgi:hypothetical protein